MTRRRLLAAFGISAVALVGNGLAIEPRRLVITRHRIRSAAAAEPRMVARLVHVTDLHLQRVNEHVRRIARAINKLRPDIVVFTGDMIDRADRVGELREFLALLARTPRMYATLGNWEHWARVDIGELTAAYGRVGCRLLVNETAVHEHNGRQLVISGLDDWTGGTPDLAAALHDVTAGDAHIVLAHSPVYRDVLADALRAGTDGPGDLSRSAISCVLSGHTHGGQVSLFGWAPIRPAGSGRYVSGWYRDSMPQLYVSRGLGTSLAPIRFGAPPEIAMFEWEV